MIATVRNWFKPPVFADENQTQTAWLFNLLLLTSMGATLLMGFVDPSLGALRLAAVFLFGLELVCLFLLRLRHLRAAILLFLLSAWGVIMFAAYFSGGLNSSVLIFTVVLLLLSGILAGERFAAVFFVINLLAVTAFWLMSASGALPAPRFPTTPVRRWASYLGTFGLVSVLVRMTLITLRNSLRRARHNELELAVKNTELENIRANLEKHVAERTQALEKRALQLQAAAEIGQAAASVPELEELLQSMAVQISERFGFYHVGIFLLDPTGEYAVLRASNSAGGIKMLERRHSLKVGETGIVGYVTQTGQARIALDVGRDVVYFNNPDLPETHSEMALPLVAGETMLGALDVQSRQPGAFKPEDITVLQVLANQLATAIQNARLMGENRRALDAAQRAYQEMSQKAWDKFLAARPIAGYRSTAEATEPATAGWLPEMIEAQSSGASTVNGGTVAIPIKIRSNPSGVVRLTKPDGRAWNDKEIAFMETLAEQLGQALEAARLYSETQQRAERERLTGEIVSRIRAGNDPQTILNTALGELQRALGVKQAHIRYTQTSGQSADPAASGNGRQAIEETDSGLDRGEQTR